MIISFIQFKVEFLATRLFGQNKKENLTFLILVRIIHFTRLIDKIWFLKLVIHVKNKLQNNIITTFLFLYMWYIRRVKIKKKHYILQLLRIFFNGTLSILWLTVHLIGKIMIQSPTTSIWRELEPLIRTDIRIILN
jgi:hypothetical protein